MNCHACKKPGVLAIMPNNVVLCTACISSLKADGFPVPDARRCAICSKQHPSDDMASSKAGSFVCKRCHKKWLKEGIIP